MADSIPTLVAPEVVAVSAVTLEQTEATLGAEEDSEETPGSVATEAQLLGATREATALGVTKAVVEVEWAAAAAAAGAVASATRIGAAATADKWIFRESRFANTVATSFSRILSPFICV